MPDFLEDSVVEGIRKLRTHSDPGVREPAQRAFEALEELRTVLPVRRLLDRLKRDDPVSEQTLQQAINVLPSSDGVYDWELVARAIARAVDTDEVALSKRIVGAVVDYVANLEPDGTNVVAAYELLEGFDDQLLNDTARHGPAPRGIQELHVYVLERMSNLGQRSDHLRLPSLDATSRARVMRIELDDPSLARPLREFEPDDRLGWTLTALVENGKWTTDRVEDAVRTSMITGIAAVAAAIDLLKPSDTSMNALDIVGNVAMQILEPTDQVEVLRRIDRRYNREPLENRGQNLAQIESEARNLNRLAIAEEALNGSAKSDSLAHYRSVAASNRAATLRERWGLDDEIYRSARTRDVNERAAGIGH
ncbi:MAG: hypothetical protein ACOYNI_11310 [Acidimicrobiia bacterium]